jgi:6-phosphogluconolactonase (cycloisomerase 2 family)
VGNISCSNNNAIASFAVDSPNGSVSYLGNVNIGYESSSAISLLGNNNYAYSALNDNCMYGGISSFDRAAGGLLSYISATVTPAQGPPAPPGATSSGVKVPSYAANLTATDTTNHVAMTEVPCYAVAGVADTQVQLATYTADSDGNLTTADTYATMPATLVTTPLDLVMSPSGALLAVAGVGGVQIFHFNGASPVTSFTALLTADNIGQVAWDSSSSHLYAITEGLGPYSGKLHVFTVTATGATEAPGSPYTIATPGSVAVLSQ